MNAFGSVMVWADQRNFTLFENGKIARFVNVSGLFHNIHLIDVTNAAIKEHKNKNAILPNWIIENNLEGYLNNWFYHYFNGNCKEVGLNTVNQKISYQSSYKVN